MKENKEKKQEKEVGEIKHPVSTRGRVFEGCVIKKFHKRIVIEFERNVFVQKYERFYKKKSRIHARLPEGIDVSIGDHVKVQECRPLSKIIHHIVIEKIKSTEDKK